MPTIAIVDDHEIVRIGLRTILDQEKDYTITHEFEMAEDVRSHIDEITDTVDIILLDLELPDCSEFELLDYLVEHTDKPKIIILTSHTEEDFAIQAIKHGARGFLSKTFDILHVKKAIVSVLSGGLFLSPHATELLRFGGPTKPANIIALNPALESLSHKERQVFHYICEGLTLKEIAFEMDCSMKTISTYKGRLMEKLNARSLVDIIIWGVKNGLVAKANEA